MEELAQSAHEMLLHIRNQAIKDPTIFNFIRSVKNSANAVPEGNGELDKVWHALNSIQRDTTQIRDKISKSSMSDSSESAAIWRIFRAKEWQAGLKAASAPHSSNSIIIYYINKVTSSQPSLLSVGKDEGMAQDGIPTPSPTEKSAATDPAPSVLGAPSRPRYHFANMDELAKSAQEMLLYMGNQANRDPTIFNFIWSVKNFANAVPKGDGELDKVWQALNSIQRDTAQIREKVSKSSTSDSSDSAAIWRTFRAKDWQASLKYASAPHSQGTTGSSTPGITPSELGRDSEITVKIRDEAVREQLRRSKPLDIVQRAERARGEAARKANSPALAGAAIIAARQLPSGDVSLRATDAAAAEVLRKYAAQWVEAFGGEASVRTPMWGVVVHGIPVKSMDLKPESAQAISTQILAQNQHTWGKDARIGHIGWLIRPRQGKREASIVVEFLHPEDANRAIEKSTIWEGQIHDTAILHREGRSKLCNKCQKPGHVQIQGSNKAACGHCADSHPTWECPSKQGKEVIIKCANCKGPHKATNPKCPTRLQAVQRAKEAILRGDPWHYVPESLKRVPTMIFSGGAQRQPDNPRKRVAIGSPEPEAAQPLISIHVLAPPPTKPKRGRPAKSKSSTEDSTPLPDMRDKVSAAYSATQSQYSTRTGEARSARLGPAMVPFTDLEHPERSRRYVEIAKEVLEVAEPESDDPIASAQNDTMSDE
jgi:hypothetical protein